MTAFPGAGSSYVVGLLDESGSTVGSVRLDRLERAMLFAEHAVRAGFRVRLWPASAKSVEPAVVVAAARPFGGRAGG